MAAATNKSSDEKIRQIIKALEILTQSSATKNSLSDGLSEHLIENVLHQNLVSLYSWMSGSCSHLLHCNVKEDLGLALQNLEENADLGVRCAFSKTCINVLDYLTDVLYSDKCLLDAKTAQAESCPVLSLQHEKQITSCIQFLVVLGVCPYLPHGVGIPVSQRLGPGQILLASAQDTVSTLSDTARIQILTPVLKLFLKMFNCSVIQDLIIKDFLSDILVVLIQVRYSARSVLAAVKEKNQLSPNQQPAQIRKDSTKGNIDIEGTPDAKLVLDDDKVFSIDELEMTVKECNTEMDKLIRTSGIAEVLKEILCLLGLVKSRQTVKIVPWFRRTVAGILKDIIMHPPGIQKLMESFLGDSPSYDTKDWQNCRAVARIITLCPVNPKNKIQFYSLVCQQLLDLIKSDESPPSVVVMKAVGAAILELDSIQAQLVEDICFSPLMSYLTSCTRMCANPNSVSLDGILVSETALTSCIIQCHRLFIKGQETPFSPVCAKLTPAIGVLFALHQSIYQTVSHLRSHVKDLVVGYLSQTDTQTALASLLEILLPSSVSGGLHPPVHPSVVFVSGPGGGVQAAWVKEKREDVDSWTRPAQAVVDILKCVESDDLNSELFLVLLQRLTGLVSSETSSHDDIVLPARLLSGKTKTARLDELREKVALVSLISMAGEEFGASLIQNTSQILLFTQVTLERCLGMCEGCDDPQTLTFEWETVTMALGLLSAVLGVGWEFTDGDKKILDSILPLLSTLSQSEAAEPHIRHMANDLRVSVATRGLVSLNLSKEENVESSKSPSHSHSDKEKVSGETPSQKKLIEEISSPGSDSKDADNSESDQDYFIDGKDWQEAMAEVKDAMVPVRGHGLIQLTRLVEEKREEVASRCPTLLKVFLNNLCHTDSYIYLASINGLVALSDLCSDKVVPCLTSEFRSKCQDDHHSWEITLKVGEALVKATRRMGELSPKYRDILLSSILCGVRHDNAMVRASCLSGLADVCQLLRYAISPILQEILLCCHTVLTSDSDPDPRRAAALTLASLLKGLGNDAVTVLNNSLSDLYKSLKNAVHRDSDEKVKIHAQLALEELDSIMKQCLFPRQELKKSIKILGYH